MTTLRAKNVQS